MKPWNYDRFISPQAENSKTKTFSLAASRAQEERQTTSMWKLLTRVRSRCWFSGEFKIELKKGFLIKSMPPILVCPHNLHNLPAHTRKFPPETTATHFRKSSNFLLWNELVAESSSRSRKKKRVESESWKTVILNRKISRVFSATKPSVVAVSEEKKAVCVEPTPRVRFLTRRRRRQRRKNIEETWNVFFSLCD